MSLRPVLLVLPCLALLNPFPAQAQSDEAAVRQAVLAHYSAIAAGDINAILEHHAGHFTGFLFDNGLLMDFSSHQEQNAAWAPMTEAGFRWDADVRHMQVVVNGSTAVAMFYATGTITMPGQSPAATTRRVTEVWVKDGGSWLELHHHDSPLIVEN